MHTRVAIRRICRLRHHISKLKHFPPEHPLRRLRILGIFHILRAYLAKIIQGWAPFGQSASHVSYYEGALETLREVGSLSFGHSCNSCQTYEYFVYSRRENQKLLISPEIGCCCQSSGQFDLHFGQAPQEPSWISATSSHQGVTS